MTKKPIKTLICCCCGQFTKGRQWYNRDKGYGVCPKCIKSFHNIPPDEIKDNYGIKGFHYDIQIKNIGVKYDRNY